LFYVLFLSIVLFYVLLVCKCVMYYCHRVSTQLQLNISYHILSYQTFFRNSGTQDQDFTFFRNVASYLPAHTG